jgi:hypothetical protein
VGTAAGRLQDRRRRGSEVADPARGSANQHSAVAEPVRAGDQGAAGEVAGGRRSRVSRTGGEEGGGEGRKKGGRERRGTGVTTPSEIIPYYRLNHSIWSLSDNKEVSR